MSTPSIGGVTGGASYNTKTHGFTASINALGANALNYDLENNVLTGNENFLADMAKAKALAMGGELSEEAKKKLAATMADAHGRYVQGILEANPNNKELADAAGDPDAFQAKVKELDKGGKLNHPSDKFGTVDTGKSRSGFGVIGGFFEDVGRSIAGKEISFGSGYIDEKGNFHQRTCFVAGTKVTKLKQEYYKIASTLEPNAKYEEQVAIETIQVGDWVLSKSDATGGVGYRQVANTFVRQTDAIYKVTFADGTILETTWNHPFRVMKTDARDKEFNIENTKWKQAKDLISGDIALSVNGATLSIVSIEIDERSETVYNFEVDEYHTYFVGETGVWVHNADKYGLEEFSNVFSQVAELCRGADPSCYQATLELKRKAQAQSLYNVGSNNNPTIADTQYLQDLFETRIVSDSTDLKDKLTDILKANQGDGRGTILGSLNPGFEFAINSGDNGFTDDFTDPHESSRRQVGHFLTAVGLARSISDDVAIRAIISHEQVADTDTFWNRTSAVFTTSSEDVQKFKDAVRMVNEDNGNLRRAMNYLEENISVDRNLEGNSYQDLKLSLAGYWMGKAIDNGRFRSGAEVSAWIKDQLQRK
ncbi:hypothetical protein EHQ47_05030 [Leptospira bourretii]|uniref:polymorphic toxin-type HINT domain-containing protein n=1 Tax=Leptospira bourretii TaxID=2484962 RepID=UPI0010914D19|nr:polymorphic toxin-type HINT domain-containing protein [Leptospira bourretii]TGL23756.1 hypothetical protein EHQ47_05030 [Leptospira bourretii]